MSVVASVISQLSYKVDALHVKVAKLQSAAQASSDAGPSDGSIGNDTKLRDIGSLNTTSDPVTEWAAKQELDDAVSDLRGLIDDVKNQHTTGLRKERGVIEAVLTQKLDKRVADKVHGVVAEKVAEKVAESMAESKQAGEDAGKSETHATQADLEKVVGRLTRVSAEVDRQARFLSSLDGKIRETVERAVRESSKVSANSVMSPTDPADPADPTDPSNVTLEDAPSLDSPRPGQTQYDDTDNKPIGNDDARDEDDSAVIDNASEKDEIDMVKAGDSDGKAKKRAPPRKKK